MRAKMNVTHALLAPNQVLTESTVPIVRLECFARHRVCPNVVPVLQIRNATAPVLYAMQDFRSTPKLAYVSNVHWAALNPALEMNYHVTTVLPGLSRPVMQLYAQYVQVNITDLLMN